MEKAKGEFEINVDSNISVNEKGKLKPQIKIINVSKDEVDVVDNIKWKNPWLENLIQDADNDFKIIKEMNAKDNNYKHYVIKCTPQIRKAIYERNDKGNVKAEIYTKRLVLISHTLIISFSFFEPDFTF